VAGVGAVFQFFGDGVEMGLIFKDEGVGTFCMEGNVKGCDCEKKLKSTHNHPFSFNVFFSFSFFFGRWGTLLPKFFMSPFIYLMLLFVCF
jgi:hypothetical protein